MHPSAQAYVIGPPHEIHTETGGQAGHGRVGTAEGRGHNADGKEHQRRLSQHAAAAQRGQQRIARGRRRHLHHVTEVVEQHTQRHEQEVHGQIERPVHTHIQLALAQCLARQVLLHHVLVQARHHDHDEYAAHELLPEVLLAARIVKDKHTAHGAFAHRCHGFCRRQSQLSAHLHDDEHQCREQHHGLQAVAPHDGADAAVARIEPYQQQHDEHRKAEAHAIRAEDHLLQDEAHEVETDAGTDELAHEEERSTRSVAGQPEATVQIGIDAGQVEPIVHRQQDKGHSGIAQYEAHARLQVGHLRDGHHARHADERHSAHAGTYHAEGHRPPGRPPSGTEEGVVITPPSRDHRKQEQQDKVSHRHAKQHPQIQSRPHP